MDKDPTRCDPADSTPVAAYSGKVAELTIDERIRQVVGKLVADVTPREEEPTLQDLAMLEQLDGESGIVTPHQMAAMEVEAPRTDLDSFLQTLSADEVTELRELVGQLDNAGMPPDGPVAAEPPADANQDAPPGS